MNLDLLCPDIPPKDDGLSFITNFIKWKFMLISYTLRDAWDVDGNRTLAENINNYYLKFGRSWW